MTKRYVIVGSSAAGVGALTKIKELDPTSEVVCVSQSSFIPYNTCLLADFLACHKKRDQITIRPQEYFEKNAIELMLSKTVTKLDPQQKKIVLDDGQEIFYTSLFLGLGASARWISLPESDGLQGVFAFHSLHDTLRIMRYSAVHSVKHVTLVGAGLTGLECADALLSRGMKVSVIERSEQVLPHLIDAPGAHMIHERMRALGVDLHLHDEVSGVDNAQGKVSGVHLKSGKTIATQLIIIAIGAAPNSQLLEGFDVPCEHRYVIPHDDLSTSLPGVYVGGDLCKVKDLVTGKRVPSVKWSDAMMQGMIAAHGMVGDPRTYQGTIMSLGSQFFGIAFSACGTVKEETESVLIARNDSELYHKLTFDQGMLSGFLMIGQVRDVGTHRRLIAQRASFEVVCKELALPYSL